MDSFIHDIIKSELCKTLTKNYISYYNEQIEN